MENVAKNTKYFAKNKKLILILCIVGMIGILIMAAGNKNNSDKEKQTDFAALDPAKYAKEVEERVEALCNRVDGAGSAYAVVTLNGGYRAVYASDSQAGTNSTKHEVVIIGSGSNAHGLLIGYENPEIAGIGIVCSGGDNYNVRKNIISVISSAFNIGSNKIFVSGS